MHLYLATKDRVAYGCSTIHSGGSEQEHMPTTFRHTWWLQTRSVPTVHIPAAPKKVRMPTDVLLPWWLQTRSMPTIAYYYSTLNIRWHRAHLG